MKTKRLIYLNRQAVSVKAPSAVSNAVGRFTLESVGQAIVANPVCELTGSHIDQSLQQRLVGAIETNIRSLETLRCHGAVEIRIDSGRCDVMAELNVIDEAYKQAVEKELADMRVNAWTLKRDWPGARLMIRAEMNPTFKVVFAERRKFRFSDRRPSGR